MPGNGGDLVLIWDGLMGWVVMGMGWRLVFVGLCVHCICFWE